MADVRIARNAEAAAISPEEVERLTRKATDSTFYGDWLSEEQVEANARIPLLAREVYFQAAQSEHQHLAAAFAGERLAGFMIATRHGPGDHELDWLMVDPEHHGSGLADLLMREGMAWLGMERPMWLTVLRHNERAIRFYRKYGFDIDEGSDLRRAVPSWIMRRPGAPLLRPFRKGDAEAGIDLLEDSYRTTWAPHVGAEAWRTWTAQQRPRGYVEAMGEEFVVAEIDGEIAGMIHWRQDFIHAVHVYSRFRRRGIGRMLVSHAERAIAEAGHEVARLETDSFNTASRTFYAALGYVETGSRPDEEWGGGFLTLLLVKQLRDHSAGT